MSTREKQGRRTGALCLLYSLETDASALAQFTPPDSCGSLRGTPCEHQDHEALAASIYCEIKTASSTRRRETTYGRNLQTLSPTSRTGRRRARREPKRAKRSIGHARVLLDARVHLAEDPEGDGAFPQRHGRDGLGFFGRERGEEAVADFADDRLDFEFGALRAGEQGEPSVRRGEEADAP